MSQSESTQATNPDHQVDQESLMAEGSLEQPEKPDANATVDITGDHVKVPTYFVVDEPDGEEKALHHVKDAEEISDVIRQARTDQDGNRIWR
jgi:hypothetical protein